MISIRNTVSNKVRQCGAKSSASLQFSAPAYGVTCPRIENINE